MIMIPTSVINDTVQYSRDKVIAYLEEHEIVDFHPYVGIRSSFGGNWAVCSCGRCDSCKQAKARNAGARRFAREGLPRLVESYCAPYFAVYSDTVDTFPLMKRAVDALREQYHEDYVDYVSHELFIRQAQNLAWTTLTERVAVSYGDKTLNEIVEEGLLSDFIFNNARCERPGIFTQAGDDDLPEEIRPGILNLDVSSAGDSEDSPPRAPRASFNSGSFFGSTYYRQPVDTNTHAYKLSKQVETYSLFLGTLAMQVSWSGYFGVIGMFLNTHCKVSLVDPMFEWAKIVIEDMVCGSAYTQAGEFDSPLDDKTFFHKMVNCWKQISDSAFVVKIKKFAAVLSALLASTILGTKVDAEKFSTLWKSLSEHASCVDMFAQLMHNVIWILDRGISVMSGEVRFMDIFSSETAGQSFDLRFSRLMGSVDEMEANTGKECYTPEQALMLIVKLEDECARLLRKSKSKAENVMFGRQIKDLRAMAVRINIIAANSEIRRAPFAICLNGDTGVGKSANVGIIITTLQRALDVGIGSRYVHSHNSDDKYFSGYTAYTNTIVLDDIGNTKENFVTEAPSNVIIAIINNQPRFAVMADVTDKGKLAIRPDIVIGTTNVKDLRSNVYTNAPLSMLRRFKFHVTMRVKDEYKKPGTDMLDPGVEPHEHSHDLWIYDVEEAIAGPSSSSVINTAATQPCFIPVIENGEPMTGISFSKLLVFLVNRSRVHKEQQTRLVERSVRLKDADFCVHDIPSAVCLECDPSVHVQAGNYYNPRWGVKEYVACASLLYEYTLPSRQAQVFATFVAWTTIWSLFSEFGNCSVLSRDIINMCATFFCALVVTVIVYYYRFYRDMKQLCRPGESIFSLLGARDRMARLASDGRRVIRSHYKLAGSALVVLTGIYSAYMCFYRIKVETQGSAFVRPLPPDLGPKPDPWRRPVVDRNLVNPDLRTTTGRQWAETLVSRLCTLRLHGDDATKGKQCLCFPVKTGFWIAPYHILSLDYKYVTINQWGEDALNSSHKFLREGSYVRIAKTDFVLMYVPGKGDTKNFLNSFPETIPQLDGRAARLAWAKRIESEEGYAKLLKGVACVNVTTAVVSPLDCDFSYHGGNYDFTMPTWDGMCGAPLVVEGGGTYILGIHSAGQTGTTTARYGTVLRGEIQSAIDELTGKFTVCMQGAETAPLNFDYPEHGFPFMEGLKHNSKCNYIEGEYKVLGHHGGQPRTFRSKVVKTVISDAVADIMDVPCVTGPPAYIGSWLPWHVWLKSCSKPCPLPYPDLTKAFVCLRGKIFDYLDKRPHLKDKIHPLPDDNVLAGADGVRGCYALNFNASAGIPWCKPKKEFMVDSERKVEGITNPKDIPEWLHAAIEHAEHVLASGKRIYAPHRCNLKDEPIPLDKAKVRVFSGTNMVYLFLMRRYFLTISMLMQDHYELFECAIGINCFSKEWDELHAYVTKFGADRIVAGDYKGYDQIISAQMTMAAFKLLIAIAEWAGYTERQLCIMRGLATETCFPLYEVDGEIIQLNGSNPSGHPLTGIINNIVNCLYMRFVFYKVQPAGSTVRFHDAVALICYGDDNKMSVSKEAPWFTHTVIQAVLGTFGIVYTMADKSAGSIPYVHDSQASFLKRNFQPDLELGRVLCPLETKSIFKSLHTVVRSDFMSLEEQSIECVKNANREFFFHGKEVFKLRHEQLTKVVDATDLTHYLPGRKLQDFEEVKEWFLQQ